MKKVFRSRRRLPRRYRFNRRIGLGRDRRNGGKSYFVARGGIRL